MTNRFLKACAVAALVSGISAPALAQDNGHAFCSVEALAGNWVFASNDAGRFFEDGTATEVATVMGSLSIETDGTFDGEFDLIFGGVIALLDVFWEGEMTVDPDCRGTTFFSVPAFGTSRSDTIAVVSAHEILGMSLDPTNIWSYQMRKLPGR